MSWDGLTPPYSTIVADPPWPYDDQPFSWRKEAGETQFLPYSTMRVDDIAALPVADLALPSSHLYLWTTNRFLFAARDVMLGWGFEYSQILTWCKPPGGGAKAVGTFNIETEFVLFGRFRIPMRRQVKRAGALIHEARVDAGINRAELHRLVRGGTPTGIVQRWEDDDSLPNATDWARLQEVLPVLADIERPYVEPPAPSDASRCDRNWWEWARGPHSQKPSAFLDEVERVSPGPRVELFARAPRLGWDSWGLGYESGPISGDTEKAGV